VRSLPKFRLDSEIEIAEGEGSSLSYVL
jgi:hypothetical protein